MFSLIFNDFPKTKGRELPQGEFGVNEGPGLPRGEFGVNEGPGTFPGGVCRK